MTRPYILLLPIFLFTLPSFGQGYRIGVCIADQPHTEIILSHRYGDRFFVDDTAKTQFDGCAVFTDTFLLDQGMYQVVFPDKKYIEFFIGEGQNFGLSTLHKSLIDSLRFTNSPENEAFRHWMFDHDWKTAITLLGNHVAGRFLSALKPVDMPTTITDRTAQYYYLRAHFFDQIDFGDANMLRTPLIISKLDQYFNQLVPPIPDSVIHAVDEVILLARKNHEVLQYVVQYLFNLYAEPEIMGMDAVYVHMAENFYLNGQADWIDAENLLSITQRVSELKPLLIGNPAPMINGLETPQGDAVSIQHIKSQFTVLYFWEPGCSHCKESTPRLLEDYEMLKKLGAEIVAINTRNEVSEWNSFIQEHKLTWINVYAPHTVIDVIQKYLAWTTPKVIILDKDKKIIGKDLSVEQVLPFIKQVLQPGGDN